MRHLQARRTASPLSFSAPSSRSPRSEDSLCQDYAVIAYLGSKITLRFTLREDGAWDYDSANIRHESVNDGWYIDDVEIRELD